MSLTALGQACVELWQAGKSAGIIAAELSARFGRMTRSAVMGQIFRARRLGLCGYRGTTRAAFELPNLVREREKRKAQHGGKRIVKLKASARPLPLMVLERPAAPLPFLELGLRGLSWHREDGCRMLYGNDPERPQWCNAPIVPGTVWCPYHYGRVYRQRAV